MKRFLALLLSMLTICACAIAQEAPAAAPAVTATGCASVAVEPDEGWIILHVTASDETLAEAETKAADSVDSLKYALLSTGVQAADVTITRTNAQLDHKYNYNKLQEPVLETIGCTVEYVLSAKAPEIGKLRAIVDAVVVNGRYASYEIIRQSSQREAAYQEALEAAASSAMAKAEALARACGVRKTALVSVVELAMAETDECSVTAQVEVTLRAAE